MVVGTRDNEQQGAAGDTAAPPAASAGRTAGRPDRRAWLVLVVLAVPLVVAAVAGLGQTWYVHGDHALTEMQVRDVWSSDPPLVGLAGRIQHDGVAGNHPGPISFYLLAVPYALLGSSAWALEVATLLVGGSAIALAVWIGWRRRGPIGLTAVAAAMALLLLGYGPERWTVPWNPDIPLLWWPVVLLASWSGLCRDWPMLAVFALAGSVCAQTHLPYLGLVGGMGLLVFGYAVWSVWSDRRSTPSTAGDGDVDGRAPGSPATRWLAAGIAVLFLLWLPPLVDQVVHDPGNGAIIAGQFLDGDAPVAGWRSAVDVATARLDPVDILTGTADANDRSLLGLALAVTWLVAAGVAAARRHAAPRDLLCLHVVAGTAAVLGGVSISRVQGAIFPYLTMWLWGTAVAMVAAAIWTSVTLVPGWAAGQHGDGAARAPAAARLVVPVLAAIAVVAVAVTTADAAGRPPVDTPDRDALHAEVLPPAFDALADGEVAGFGPEDRYLVEARDAFSSNMSRFTLLDEAERRGLDAAVPPEDAASVGEGRVLEPDEATAVLTYAAGAAIDDLRADPDAVELAYADLAPDDRAAAAAARAEAVAALEDAGRPEAVELLDDELFGAAITGRLPDSATGPVQRMLELGEAIAVFVSRP
jgi:hypothetical protein